MNDRETTKESSTLAALPSFSFPPLLTYFIAVENGKTEDHGQREEISRRAICGGRL
jgi:hypothetical protein